MDVTKSHDPFAPDVPNTHMMAGAERSDVDEPEPSAEPSAVDAPADAPEDAFAFTDGGTALDPTPPPESAGPTEDPEPEGTPTKEDEDELPTA